MLKQKGSRLVDVTLLRTSGPLIAHPDESTYDVLQIRTLTALWAGTGRESGNSFGPVSDIHVEGVDRVPPISEPSEVSQPSSRTVPQTKPVISTKTR